MELYRTDLTDTERQLSELVFSHYHSNPKPGQRSRVSDEFARSLSGDEAGIMRMATLLAKMVAPEQADNFDKVIGFYVEPSILHSLAEILKRPGSWVDYLLEQPLVRPSGNIDPHVLWAKAYQKLQEHYSDVCFDHEYTQNETGSYRPGIHGEGVNLVSVNGAIIAVLIHENLLHHDYFQFMATTQDDSGWVYSQWDLS